MPSFTNLPQARLLRVCLILVLLLLPSTEAAAQSNAPLPAPALEITGGYAGFLDDDTVDHALVGGALRVHLLPRVSIGPEIQYMIGPRSDRDLILTGNVTLDVLPPDRKLTPYFVAGAGLFHHRSRFGTETFSSNEGAFTAGGGVRGWITDRMYVAGEARIGWELHLRFSGTLGIALGR